LGEQLIQIWKESGIRAKIFRQKTASAREKNREKRQAEEKQARFSEKNQKWRSVDKSNVDSNTPAEGGKGTARSCLSNHGGNDGGTG